MVSKYQLIANEIRNKILLDTYKINQAIPSELQLQKEYEVSRHTIRQAISVLANEGYLRKEKGSGTYVDDKYQQKDAKQTENKTIGVITTYLSDYIFPSIIRGIEKTLSEKGYSLLLASTNNNYAQEKNCLEKMIRQNVEGLIIEPTKSNQYNPNLSFYAQLKEKEIPLVMINAKYEELDVPAICVDDVKGGFLATELLINNGHQEILLLTKLDDLQGKYRLKGFIQACEEYKINFSNEDIFTYTTETKENVMQELVNYIQNNPDKSGIVCYNDQVAHELCSELLKNGVEIPEELSIVGNDNSFLKAVGQMVLSTLEHPKEEMGVAAADWIINAVEKRKEPSGIIYSPVLIEGDTVKNIRLKN